MDLEGNKPKSSLLAEKTWIPCPWPAERSACCSLGVKNTELTLIIEDTRAMFFQTLSNVTRVDMTLICIPHSATRTSSQPRNPSRINENKAKIHFPREKSLATQTEVSRSIPPNQGSWAQHPDYWSWYCGLIPNISRRKVFGGSQFEGTQFITAGMVVGVLRWLVTSCPQSEAETGNGTQISPSK